MPFVRIHLFVLSKAQVNSHNSVLIIPPADKALATAIGQLPATHRPNFHNTEPSWEIPYHPNWSNDSIVALDPWGHITPQIFRESHYDQGIDIRPSIAVTRAHLKVLEIDEAVRAGRIPVDGKIVLKSPHPNLVSATSSAADQDYGVEVNVSKAAVEPVWYLPGVAKRFGIEEGLLRRALFEDGGGQYPELLTRPDLKVFLPPMYVTSCGVTKMPLLTSIRGNPSGGLTVYVFGPTEYLSDTSKELTLRVHDECNVCVSFITLMMSEMLRNLPQGSDVFGSDSKMQALLPRLPVSPPGLFQFVHVDLTCFTVLKKPSVALRKVASELWSTVSFKRILSCPLQSVSWLNFKHRLFFLQSAKKAELLEKLPSTWFTMLASVATIRLPCTSSAPKTLLV